MADLVIQASGSLIESGYSGALELPISWCWHFCNPSMGLGWWMMKELDLKLTLRMAESIKTESPPDEESWEGCQQFESWSDPK